MRWLLAITGQQQLLEANPAPRAQLPQPPALHRSPEPPADRAAEALPGGRDRRRGEAHDPAHDQRHRLGAAQQRLSGAVAGPQRSSPRFDDDPPAALLPALHRLRVDRKLEGHEHDVLAAVGDDARHAVLPPVGRRTAPRLRLPLPAAGRVAPGSRHITASKCGMSALIELLQHAVRSCLRLARLHAADLLVVRRRRLHRHRRSHGVAAVTRRSRSRFAALRAPLLA